ncbi:hypothetical protein BU16DRAFT_557782 [Lophium mytilinum]|uniref:Uncharacterized protein n=1 Tax=Lophium mytilinum TaxID=390894 RepID=A0A6A6R4K5_9PEZI|nr:hypothetical protein BU16DRAFT_557782 [Lophium mytilinum]
MPPHHHALEIQSGCTRDFRADISIVKLSLPEAEKAARNAHMQPRSSNTPSARLNPLIPLCGDFDQAANYLALAPAKRAVSMCMPVQGRFDAVSHIIVHLGIRSWLYRPLTQLPSKSITGYVCPYLDCMILRGLGCIRQVVRFMKDCAWGAAGNTSSWLPAEHLSPFTGQ